MTGRDARRMFVRGFGIELITRGVFVATFVAGLNAMLRLDVRFGWPGWFGVAIGTALWQAFRDVRAARREPSAQ